MDSNTTNINNSNSEEGTLSSKFQRPKAQIGHGEFLRIEDKYIVPNAHLSFFKELLNARMHSGFPDKTVTFAYVESVYFDSPELDFFIHDLAGLETRYKLRVRRYAPSGDWSEEQHLELKRKKGQESRKVRFLVGRPERNQLDAGEIIVFNQHLEDINPKVDKEALRERVKKIDELILKYTLKPVCTITCHRLAFELGDLRVTIDTGLNSLTHGQIDKSQVQRFLSISSWKNAEKLLENFNVQDSFILEVKHTGSIPEWLQMALFGHNLAKTSMSKYTYFMSKAIAARSSFAGD